MTTDKTRAAAKAEEVLQKMQATLTINANNSLSSSSVEVDNILGQIKKEAVGQTKPKHMQVIGLEEEVRLKEITIKGLYSKISKMETVISLSNEKIAHLEGIELENNELKAVVEEKEALQEENEKLKEEMSKLKEKNKTVLGTAKDHQKSWKDYISKLEAKMSKKEKENQILRSKMSNLIKNLEVTIEELSDLQGPNDVDEIEEKGVTYEDNRDDCEVKTTVEKGVSGIGPIAEKMSDSACFTRCQAAIE